MEIDMSGIFEELLAQKKTEYLSTPKDQLIREELSITTPLFLEEDSNGIMITGIALAEGMWKQTLYTPEEIEKAALNLKGKDLKVEHELDKDFTSKSVGKVVDTYYDKALRALVFKARVTDPLAIQMVKDGTFPAVSCATWLDKIPLNAEQSTGFNYLFKELSLVRQPACEKCFIFAMEQLSKSQSLSIKKDTSNKQEGIKMNENEEQVIEVLEEDKTVEPEKAYAIVECTEEQLAELKKNGKVVSVHYGKYPYPYTYDEKKNEYPKKNAKCGGGCNECPLDVLQLAEEYKKFMKDCMNTGKSMKDCATEWAAKNTTPEKKPYGEAPKEGYGVPAEQNSETFIEGSPEQKIAEQTFNPPPDVDVIAAKMKVPESIQTQNLSSTIETNKGVVPPVVPKVETPKEVPQMSEVKKEEVKKVEEKPVEKPAEVPKVEESKVEPPKVEVPKIEAPVIESPKVEELKPVVAPVQEQKVIIEIKVPEHKIEVPKVEAPPVVEDKPKEEPKVEPPKVEEPPKRDIAAEEQTVKRNLAQAILDLIKKKKFP